MSFKIYKELSKLNNKKMSNPIKKNRQKVSIDILPKVITDDKHVKRCSASYVIREFKQQLVTTAHY